MLKQAASQIKVVDLDAESKVLAIGKGKADTGRG
tara:strand:- start:222 stop:323 length:102 start_codon:yes stop_codon:yes gene_type:complete